MSKGRLEAFTDGVIAIIITVMVLEFKVPATADPGNLIPLIPIFFSYIISFITVAIYWNNHHHMFQAVEKIHGRTLWANSHLLFWLSLIPFATTWMGETSFAPYPVAMYAVIGFGASFAYYLLTKDLLSLHENTTSLSQALGKDIKGKTSILFNALAIVFAPYNPAVSVTFFMLTGLMWFVPDRRIERILNA